MQNVKDFNVRPKYSDSVEDATYRRDEYQLAKKLPVGCGAAEAPRPALDSTTNSGLVWGIDVVNWTLLLVRLSGGDRDESTCPVPSAASLFNSI
jgi:hypothetical protein